MSILLSVINSFLSVVLLSKPTAQVVRPSLMKKVPNSQPYSMSAVPVALIEKSNVRVRGGNQSLSKWQLGDVVRHRLRHPRKF